jgi:hypothetical protein
MRAFFFRCSYCDFDSNATGFLSGDLGFPGMCWRCFPDHERDLDFRLASEEEIGMLRVLSEIAYQG